VKKDEGMDEAIIVLATNDNMFVIPAVNAVFDIRHCDFRNQQTIIRDEKRMRKLRRTQ
jgi:hypothetical protein